MNLNDLRIRSRVLNNNQAPSAYKAILVGDLINRVNKKRLETDANYKAVYNNIMKRHYTTQKKFQYLEHAQNANKNNIKMIMKTVDWNLLHTNANYRALYNRVNKAVGLPSLMNETVRVRMRRQQGGTCWFHAIINGLLLTPKTRRILMDLTQGVPPLKVNGDICPTKNAGYEFFLRYIKYRLQQGGVVNSAIRNANVIRAGGFRGYFNQPGFARLSFLSVANKSLKLGGHPSDVLWFYKRFFPSNFTNRNNGNTTPMFVMKVFGRMLGSGSNPAVPHKLERNGVPYELTHSWISFWIKPFPEGHAVAGYRLRDGRYFVYDSGLGMRIDCDWTKQAAVSKIAEVYHARGYKTGDMKVYAFYTRVN
jgi:hypothetical protein